MGGGLGVDHSSVLASHGSSLASPFGFRWVAIAFTVNTSVDNAIRNAPTVETWFQNVSPRDAGYVYSRRIIPPSPRMCIGPNARLNPTSRIQNCTFPHSSSSWRANTFGHQ